MKVIYIAGRYRDKRGEYYVRKNIKDAEFHALYVWGHGGVAICPHKNTAGFNGAFGIPDKVWLDGDLELLMRSDAVWAIPGWEESEGAKKEVAFAVNIQKPVLHTKGEVKRYLEGSLHWRDK
jgi:hypothetical protein